MLYQLKKLWSFLTEVNELFWLLVFAGVLLACGVVVGLGALLIEVLMIALPYIIVGLVLLYAAMKMGVI
jgi:hypothetical protein